MIAKLVDTILSLDDLESSLSTIYEGSKTAEQHLKSYAATFQKGLDDSNEEMGKY